MGADAKPLIPPGVYMGERITSTGGIVGGRLVISDDATLSFTYIAEGSVFSKPDQIEFICEGIPYTAVQRERLIEIRLDAENTACLRPLAETLSDANRVFPPLSFFYEIGGNAIETGLAFKDSFTMHLFV